LFFIDQKTNHGKQVINRLKATLHCPGGLVLLLKILIRFSKSYFAAGAKVVTTTATATAAAAADAPGTANKKKHK